MKRTRPWPVTVTVEGLNLERFVRAAGERGIRLERMRRAGSRRLSALVPETQLPVLLDIAEHGGWRLLRGQRHGLGLAAEWLRVRQLLVAALLLAGIALFAASRVMWAVRVENGGTYTADIGAALSELGLTPPMLRRRVDLGELRDALEWRYPRIAWFECGWRGTTLVIRPVEGVLPRASTDTEGPCDVVATRDGIVEAVVTRAGTPVVSQGDFVRAGETLIRGEERTAEGAVKHVAAQGSVVARVWRGTSVTMSIMAHQTAYTGQQDTVWTLRTPWFDLWRRRDCPFERYDTSVTETRLSSIFLPVTLRTETRLEAEVTPQQRERALVEAEAREAAVRKLHEKLAPEESLIDIWGNCSMIDDEHLLYVAIGEMQVEIGRQVPVSGMAAPGSGEAPQEPR